jgi:hypothetical protein
MGAGVVDEGVREMLRRKKLAIQDELLDRVGGEVLLAARINEDEITAAASSVDLYDRVRVRIASGPEPRGRDRQAQASPLSVVSANAGGPFGITPSVRWTLAVAAAILLVIAVTLQMWLPSRSSDRPRIAQPAPQPPAPTNPGAVEPGPPTTQDSASVANVPSRPRQSPGAFHRHPRSNRHAGEVATDFLPLTFLADNAAQESGHVVRVRVSRSALIAFGVPMNVDRVGELIVADVVIGDDGLARAIRFIQ